MPPSSTTSGCGTVTIGGRSITFANIEPVTASGFATFTLLTPGGSDSLTIDSPVAGQTRITGTTAGVALEPLTFFNIGRMIVDTASNDSPGSGSDTITIAPSGVSAAGLNALALNVGGANSFLTVNGGTTTIDASLGSGGANLSLTADNSRRYQLAWEPAVRRHCDQQFRSRQSGTERQRGLAHCLSGHGPRHQARPRGELPLIVQSTLAQRSAVLAAVTGLVASARSTAPTLWQGPGITTSVSTPITGLAALLNDDGTGSPFVSTINGQGVDANSVVVKYTYNGDTNLDGRIDAADYFRIDQGFLSAGSTYRDGSFDYDTTVNGDDYYLIDTAFLHQTGALAVSAAKAGALASVFSPAGMPITGDVGNESASDPILAAGTREGAASLRLNPPTEPPTRPLDELLSGRMLPGILA